MLTRTFVIFLLIAVIYGSAIAAKRSVTKKINAESQGQQTFEALENRTEGNRHIEKQRTVENFVDENGRNVTRVVVTTIVETAVDTFSDEKWEIPKKNASIDIEHEFSTKSSSNSPTPVHFQMFETSKPSTSAVVEDRIQVGTVMRKPNKDIYNETSSSIYHTWSNLFALREDSNDADQVDRMNKVLGAGLSDSSAESDVANNRGGMLHYPPGRGAPGFMQANNFDRMSFVDSVPAPPPRAPGYFNQAGGYGRLYGNQHLNMISSPNRLNLLAYRSYRPAIARSHGPRWLVPVALPLRQPRYYGGPRLFY